MTAKPKEASEPTTLEAVLARMDAVLERQDQLEAENRNLRDQLSIVSEQRQFEPSSRARATEIVAQQILARCRTLRIDTRTGKRIKSTFQDHKIVESPRPNHACYTRIVNQFDVKRIGKFRPKAVQFYSGHQEEHLVKADFERQFETIFNPTMQEIRPLKKQAA